MVLGRPVFDASAPSLRVKGRRISNWWANLETLWAGIGDSLYGFRVYPIAALVAVMRRQPGCAASISTPKRWCGSAGAASRRSTSMRRCATSARDEGGVSHFNYWRDNALLSWMHFRLFIGFLLRLPLLIVRRLRARVASASERPRP